ncbi:MAG: hypothetical protein AAFX99_30065, partial [Myxococcota bacterium]
MRLAAPDHICIRGLNSDEPDVDVLEEARRGWFRACLPKLPSPNGRMKPLLLSPSLDHLLALVIPVVLCVACTPSAPSVDHSRVHDAPGALPWDGASSPFDPLAYAAARQNQVHNPEAAIPAQCYTRTEGVANPCWTCHTLGANPNIKDDFDLQTHYAFSDFALHNRWSNLFEDRSAEHQAITDADALAWVRQDNYTALRRAMLDLHPDFPGWIPDIDLHRGFDHNGFARDGSGWRALRYQPFPGLSWPTNGSTDDVFVRLPAALRPSTLVARANLAILEAALTGDPALPTPALVRTVEPLDETRLGLDLDGDDNDIDGDGASNDNETLCGSDPMDA